MSNNNNNNNNSNTSSGGAQSGGPPRKPASSSISSSSLLSSSSSYNVVPTLRSSTLQPVGVPNAPYPPPLDYGPIRSQQQQQQPKSALSSSPHYSTISSSQERSTMVGGGTHLRGSLNVGSSGSSSNMIGGGGMGGTEPSMGMMTTTKGGDDGGGLPSTSSSSAQSKHRRVGSGTALGGSGGSSSNIPIYSSQVMFCPGWNDLVASINCISSPGDSAVTTTANQSPQMLPQRGPSASPPLGPIATNLDETGPGKMTRKMGPVMMELRQVELVSKNTSPTTFSSTNRDGTVHHDDNDDDNDDDSSYSTDDESFFTTRVIAVSRGNPSLGTSVASTCLDLPPVQTYDDNNNNNSTMTRLMAATGSTTGALCIHQFEITPSNNVDDDRNYTFSTSIEYFHTPRHHRQASAVAWRPPAGNANHVAIGLVGTTITLGGNNTGKSSTGNMTQLQQQQQQQQQQNLRRSNSNAARVVGGDREFCCFVWDIVDSKKTTSPLTKLALNNPVASLAWMMDGQTLAVGGHQRTVQLYDMRQSGTNNNAPPLSAHAHEFGVHGIQVDPRRPYVMATFCRAVGEPVKLFDIRRMDSVMSEIKVASIHYHHHGATSLSSSASANASTSLLSNSTRKIHQTYTEAIQWSTLEAGVLSVATADSVQDYDTMSGSRPTLIRMVNCKGGGAIRGIALYRGSEGRTVYNNAGLLGKDRRDDVSDRLLSQLYPHRMLTVHDDRSIHDVSKGTNAPLAISHRDGRVVHALGPHVWVGHPATDQDDDTPDDISVIMMRRARCNKAISYSMNPEVNIKLLSNENTSSDSAKNGMTSSRKQRDSAVRRLWSWIDRVESLSFQDYVDVEEEQIWWAKGLLDAGAWHLLGMDAEQNDTEMMEEGVSVSETFLCNVYDSPGRRAALTACGWAGKFDLTNVMGECEALDEFERSAALAIWHGDILAAVEALERASEAIRVGINDRKYPIGPETSQYAETLDLVSMCIAGFGGKTASQLSVWKKACASLLRRPELSAAKAKQGRIAYLRGVCQFLLNVGTTTSHSQVLDDVNLSLSDRIAFACTFLGRKELKSYLIKSVESCKRTGNVEGLVITGLSKSGISILQSFVDRSTDVQTAALVVSRVVLPNDWAVERKMCTEWVESYRTLLNTWQLWQTRAMFDVDRADILRRFKARNNPGSSYQRRLPNPRVRQSPKPLDQDIMPSIPAQLEVRCNYCSSPLSLKRSEGTTNQWLSKMQPMLNCCPQCRKPLPRCSICMLSMGAMNPYMELTRERSRPGPRGASGKVLADDLSQLSSMNFAEWYTWCMRCKHGGHAHHIIGWFSTHKKCPVSGCECNCQFDASEQLNRPALSGEVEACKIITT